MLTRTNLKLANGLTAPSTKTMIDRVTFDYRRDNMRVHFTTKMDDEKGAPVDAHSVQIPIPPAATTAIEAAAEAALAAQDERFA